MNGNRSIPAGTRKAAWLAIAVFGGLLPYMARVPGMALHGRHWLTQMTEGGIGGFIFLELFAAALWGGILGFTASYRHLRCYAFPLVPGFGFALYGYASLDLASSSTAALDLVFIPLDSVPLALAGFLAGRWYDHRLDRRAS